MLWSFYGFRYQARPNGLQLNPPLAEYVQGLKPHEAWIVSTMARWHVLPESYLYGLADVRLTADFYTSYVLGKIYAHGVWFYFPVAFVIKSTLAFLALLLLTVAAIATRRLNCWREILFLVIPPVFYLLVAVSGGMNIGVRHILPVYVFLSVLIGGASMGTSSGRTGNGLTRFWRFCSSTRCLPGERSPSYLAYSNELWGGPSNTYKYLTDSNVDWGQQLKATKQYLDQRGVKDCWFVYFAEGVAEPSYYGIPCKPLPTINTLWLNQQIDVPASIDGPVLISASNLSGVEFGPGSLNPYEQFKQLRAHRCDRAWSFCVRRAFRDATRIGVKPCAEGSELARRKASRAGPGGGAGGGGAGAGCRAGADNVGRCPGGNGTTRRGSLGV